MEVNPLPLLDNHVLSILPNPQEMLSHEPQIPTTIIIVDINESTAANSLYYLMVNKIVSEHPTATVVLWNITTKVCNPPVKKLSVIDAFGILSISALIPLLEAIKKDVDIIVCTDCSVSNLFEHKLLRKKWPRVRYVTIYMTGEPYKMGKYFSVNLFPNSISQIFINKKIPFDQISSQDVFTIPYQMILKITEEEKLQLFYALQRIRHLDLETCYKMQQVSLCVQLILGYNSMMQRSLMNRIDNLSVYLVPFGKVYREFSSSQAIQDSQKDVAENKDVTEILPKLCLKIPQKNLILKKISPFEILNDLNIIQTIVECVSETNGESETVRIKAVQKQTRKQHETDFLNEKKRGTVKKLTQKDTLVGECVKKEKEIKRLINEKAKIETKLVLIEAQGKVKQTDETVSVQQREKSVLRRENLVQQREITVQQREDSVQRREISILGKIESEKEPIVNEENLIQNRENVVKQREILIKQREDSIRKRGKKIRKKEKAVKRREKLIITKNLLQKNVEERAEEKYEYKVSNFSKGVMQENDLVVAKLFNRRPNAWLTLVFLYIMATYHPTYKMYRKLFLSEIRNISEKTKTKFQLYNPVEARLCTVMWYIIQVSHLAFPDTSSLRMFGRHFYDLYITIFPEIVPNIDRRQLEIWDIWKYFISFGYGGKTELYLEILAQFQDYKHVQNRKLVIFEGACVERFGFLKNFELGLVLKVFSIFQRKSFLYRFDSVNLNKVQEEKTNFIIIMQDPTTSVTQSTESILKHVKINLLTCHPFVFCPLTKLHWKECAGKYDVELESYVNLFRRYSQKYKKFPLSAEDLLIFEHERYFKKRDEVRIFNRKDIYSALNAVMLMFEPVMNNYTYEEYMKCNRLYSNEKDRLSKESGHK